MSTYYTHRTRCFYMLPDGTFPMMLRDYGSKKLWQLPGGGIDGVRTDSPEYMPRMMDLLSTTIQETIEELGWNPIADKEHPFSGWRQVCQIEVVTKSTDADYYFWKRRGINADEVITRYYFMFRRVDHMPELKLTEPDKFTQLAYVREGHLYNDIPFVKGAQFAHGIEKAYVSLGLCLSEIK